MTLSELEIFQAWIQDAGGLIQQPTNEWEVLRYNMPGRSKPAIIYRRKTGTLTLTNGAEQDFAKFQNGQRPERIRKALLPKKAGMRERLLERDGPICCFCGQLLGDDITFEHWLSAACGGNNHEANLALAHEACNRAADSACIMEKIAFRDAMREAVAASEPWVFVTPQSAGLTP